MRFSPIKVRILLAIRCSFSLYFVENWEFFCGFNLCQFYCIRDELFWSQLSRAHYIETVSVRLWIRSVGSLIVLLYGLQNLREINWIILSYLLNWWMGDILTYNWGILITVLLLCMVIDKPLSKLDFSLSLFLSLKHVLVSCFLCLLILVTPTKCWSFLLSCVNLVLVPVFTQAWYDRRIIKYLFFQTTQI